jgi:hypothetical protein
VKFASFGNWHFARNYIHALYTSTLKMETACSPETFVDNDEARWYRNQEGFITSFCALKFLSVIEYYSVVFVT